MRAANERRVAVPRLVSHHAAPEGIFNPDSLSPSGIEVLVVEDNRLQQIALAAQLDKQNASAIIVGTVKEGFRALRQKSFALMLIDMELPDGLGTKLIEYARWFPESKNREAVIIGLSSDTNCNKFHSISDIPHLFRQKS